MTDRLDLALKLAQDGLAEPIVKALQYAEARARREALEEAAGTGCHLGSGPCCGYCERAIRSLMEKP